jgi:hypothetical protein
LDVTLGQPQPLCTSHINIRPGYIWLLQLVRLLKLALRALSLACFAFDTYLTTE